MAGTRSDSLPSPGSIAHTPDARCGTGNEKARLRGPFSLPSPDRLRHGLDGGGEAAFLPGGGVLVDDPLVGDRIDDALGGLQLGLGGLLVARGDGLFHALDGGTDGGALARVVGAAADGL